jgi:integrase
MSKSNTSLLGPRRAADKLPAQAAVDAAGINLDVETAQLVARAIFRQVTKGRSQSRMGIHNTALGLAFLAREPLDRNGKHDPAPCPDMHLDRWPQGPQVFKRLGITHRDLETYGITARHHADDAVLPLEWALAFYPPEIWPMIAEVIRWGPEQTRLRMERAVMTMATTPTQRERRRRKAGEPLSLATIENRVDGVWNLMRCLVELRSLAATSPILSVDPLDAWTTLPDRIDARALGARDANLDNTGPSVTASSQRLREVAHHVEKRTTRDGYIERRGRLFIATLPLFGPRDGALNAVEVSDYQPAFRYRDGSRGPVLVIRPGKTRHPDHLHILPLPALLAEWFEDWITFTDRYIGQPDEPLFPSRKPKPGRPNTHMTTHGFYNAIAGARQAGGTGSYALLPLDGDPFIGYRPHAFRHTAKQLIMDAASRLQRADPGFYPHVHPDEFAKAVLGHELITTVSAVYRDLDQATLAKAVINEAWRILWDDGVLRRGADPDRIRAAREYRDALVITRDALTAAAGACDARAEQFRARARATRDQTRRLELHLEATSEENAALKHRAELRTTEDQLALAEVELVAAQEEQVPITNDHSDAEHDLLVHAALNGSEAEPECPTTGPLADEITVSDAADLWGVSEQTINRAHRNGQPTTKPLKWLGGKTAWHTYHQKDKRLRVDAINNAALTPDQEQRLLELRQRRAQLDAQIVHPAPNVRSDHEPNSKEQTMIDNPTIGRQTTDGLIDAWQSSGSSPPDDDDSQDDEEGAS